MPRYYFHIRRGRATVLDHHGLDLHDLREAAKEAARRGEAVSADAIVIADEEFSPVFEVPVKKAAD
jgi:hypothetical protein